MFRHWLWFNSLPAKIMFSALFCRSTSAFHWVILSLEFQPGQVYWRSGPGCTTVQKREGSRIHQIMLFKIPKSWDPYPIGRGTALFISTSHTFSACGASILCPFCTWPGRPAPPPNKFSMPTRSKRSALFGMLTVQIPDYLSLFSVCFLYTVFDN